MSNQTLSPETIGLCIKFSRERANLSQSDLARRMGISTSLISHWEKGTRNISQPNLLLAAQNIGVNLGYMLAIDGIRPKFSLTKEQERHLEMICSER